MEVNEETLGENDSSIPLKEQERNGRNAGNAYISNIFESIQYLLRMSLRDSVPLRSKQAKKQLKPKHMAMPLQTSLEPPKYPRQHCFIGLVLTLPKLYLAS